jgi:hypothetical protein
MLDLLRSLINRKIPGFEHCLSHTTDYTIIGPFIPGLIGLTLPHKENHEIHIYFTGCHDDLIRATTAMSLLPQYFREVRDSRICVTYMCPLAKNISLCLFYSQKALSLVRNVERNIFSFSRNWFKTDLKVGKNRVIEFEYRLKDKNKDTHEVLQLLVENSIQIIVIPQFQWTGTQ